MHELHTRRLLMTQLHHHRSGYLHQQPVAFGVYSVESGVLQALLYYLRRWVHEVQRHGLFGARLLDQWSDGFMSQQPVFSRMLCCNNRHVSILREEARHGLQYLY
jgi:hypothetical protein